MGVSEQFRAIHPRPKDFQSARGKAGAGSPNHTHIKPEREKNAMKRHSDSQFKPSRFRAAIAIICWSLCALSAASGATITVTSTSDSGPGSLRQAIKDAAAGDTINFSLPANGIINLTTDELLIDKSLTITGPGANTLRVQNGANFRVFEIIQPAVNVSISGLSIAHGVADFGGGIVCYSVNLTVASCTISQNSAGF